MTIIEAISRIRRAGSGRGFGIQSPGDYGFVCDIVNCRYPYYAYTEMKKELPHLPVRERKKAELLFRVANFVQPAVTINLGMAAWYEKYVARACRKTQICGTAAGGSRTLYNIKEEQLYKIKDEERLLLLVPCRKLQKASCGGGLLEYMRDGTYLIADGINAGKEAREAWERFAAESRCTLVFDLYDIGIVAVNSKRDKISYRINY